MHRLQAIHKSMNLDQFKAFIEGTIEIKHAHFCVDLIAFINTLEAGERAKLFDMLAKLIDQKQDSKNIWQKLRLYNKDCLAFIQYILISALKDDAYENHFDKLHHHCKMLCEDALKNHFVDQLTIKEWQKANA